ncbi:MAG: DUF2802 domain-containing protein [Gammaproteobacteria bacterium]|nr:DUF2802 domain-containing protein [Gammaproteobacteria bacterium]
MTSLIMAGVSVFMALLVASACYRLFKLNLQQTEKIAGLQNQLSILCAGAVGTDERIIRFEQTLSYLKEHQNTLDLGLSPQPGYDHAIRLAKKGVGIHQLIDNCNLSDEEAHLISRIHGTHQQSTKQELH